MLCAQCSDPAQSIFSEHSVGFYLLFQSAVLRLPGAALTWSFGPSGRRRGRRGGGGRRWRRRRRRRRREDGPATRGLPGLRRQRPALAVGHGAEELMSSILPSRAEKNGAETRVPSSEFRVSEFTTILDYRICTVIHTLVRIYVSAVSYIKFF